MTNQTHVTVKIKMILKLKVKVVKQSKYNFKSTSQCQS
jgi:hypothetical protein